MFKCFLQTKCEKTLFSGNKTFHLNSIEQVIKFLAYTSTRTIIVKIKPSEFLKIQASHSSAIKINSHLDAAEKAEIVAVMDSISKNSCVKFQEIPQTETKTHHIRITSGIGYVVFCITCNYIHTVISYIIF